ncbi:MAG: TolC family protein, partial [Bacteroides sp.]|nr:TolC family protein [Bacteroides sp.]
MTRVRLFFLCLLLGACVVKAQQADKYLERPLPDGWQEKDTLFQQVLPVDDEWWKVFEDATLDSLIHLAMEQNPSVLMAINRIDQAKAQWRISQSELYPSLSFNGGWERQQTSGNLGNGTPQAWTGYYSASVQMSWQLDVFGVIRQKAKAQKELYAASKEEYNATMVSLCAEVASAYFNLREMQQEVDVLRRNAASQEAVVAITETRYKTGLVSKLDVAQAKSVYYSTLASIPIAEASVIQYLNTLAVLLG